MDLMAFRSFSYLGLLSRPPSLVFRLGFGSGFGSGLVFSLISGFTQFLIAPRWIVPASCVPFVRTRQVLGDNETDRALHAQAALAYEDFKGRPSA